MPMNFETDRAIVVAALFVWRQCPNELRSQSFPTSGQSLLSFYDHPHIAVITVLLELYAAPIAGGRRGCGSIVVRVKNREAIQIKTRTNGIVVEGSHDNREPRRTDDLNGSANSVIDIQFHSACRESGICTQQFDNQAFCRTTLQPHSTECVMVRHVHFGLKNMHNICVVPNDLCRQDAATDLHAVHIIVAHAILADQRPGVVIKRRESLNEACTATAIQSFKRIQRVDINADDKTVQRSVTGIVVTELIVDDDRLGATNEDRRRNVCPTTTAARR